MPPFFRMVNIYKVDPPNDFCVDDVPLPKFILRPRENPNFVPGSNIWDGEWHLRGADLVEIACPSRSLSVQAAPFKTADKEDLNFKIDLELIQEHPVTSLHVGGELCERLEMCRILGKEFDPYKYRIFPNCSDLDVDGLARNSSFFNRHKIEVLGLIFDEVENKWIPS